MEIRIDQHLFNQFSEPLEIAGPCSVESESQLDEVVSFLKSHGIQLIRAGVWKPRTRPGSFEGIGEAALPWLKSAAEKYEIDFAIEVAKPAHVEAALKHDISVFWIGARSTANPFTVQEIAESLKGVDIPVMVKNPTNPDLELWIGALERLNKYGIEKLAAIHRGFSTYRKGRYRNNPMWEIPIELKRRIPKIPLICDPSHIAGKRALIREISQKSIDLNYDGLMTEVHPYPEKALSDANQQLSFKEFEEVRGSLEKRSHTIQDQSFINLLDAIRAQVDEADHELLEVLSRRMELIQKIGEYKRDNNVAVLQMERWNHILQTRSEWARALELNVDFILDIYNRLHTESIQNQTEIMNQKMEKL